MPESLRKRFSVKSLRLRFRSKSSGAVDPDIEQPPPVKRRASEFVKNVQAPPPLPTSFSDDSPSVLREIPTPGSIFFRSLPPSRMSTQDISVSTEQLTKSPAEASGWISNDNVTMPTPIPYPVEVQDTSMQMPIPQTDSKSPAMITIPTVTRVDANDTLLSVLEEAPASDEVELEALHQDSEGNDVMNGLRNIAVKVQDGGPKTNGSRALDAGLEETEDNINSFSANITDATQAAQPLIAAVQASGATEMIKSGFDRFMEGIPWLMKSLDEVAKIHPFVTIAVLAFKAAYTMEMTRRQNDKRIITLYVSIKDMIAVLVQLRNVKEPKDIGPDGRTIEDRLKRLADDTASDIKTCANVCDTYNKKKPLVRVLQGQVWQDRLVGWVETFTKRKGEFEFALAIHTARKVDSISNRVEAIDQKLVGLISMLTENFNKMIPQEELDLAQQVEGAGGAKAVLANDERLQAFVTKLSNKGGSSSSYTVQDLKDDVRDSLDTAIDKNFQTFQAKFGLQQRQMQEELTKFIQEQSNRVIDAVNNLKGPHDLIKHPELKAIWKEMGWRRNVKTRLFVMTLRDNFTELAIRTSTSSTVQAITGPTTETKSTDDWAFKYINVAYLQQIMEAFDEDGSGYITVTEVNSFVDALPSSLQWSLPQWIAYWAVGWEHAARDYAAKILNVFAHMNAMRARVLPDNRWWIEDYLKNVWETAYRLCAWSRSTDPGIPDWLEAKFAPYVKTEEERLHRNLQDIRYTIEGLDTVFIVTGTPTQIEKNFYALLYLLLTRDLMVFEVAKTKVLTRKGLSDSVGSIYWLYRAIDQRYTDLQALFVQQKLDVKRQFGVFACGMFGSYSDSDSPYFSNSKLKDANFIDSPSGELPIGQWREEQLLDDITEDVCPYDFDALKAPQEISDEERAEVPMPLKAILGEWSGFVYDDNDYPSLFMRSVSIRPGSSGPQGTFEGPGNAGGPTYTLAGECQEDSDGTISLKYKYIYTDYYTTEYYKAHLTPDGFLLGTQDYEDEVSEYSRHFIMTKMPQDIMLHRPPPQEFEADKPKALWKFATRAVRHQVLRERWSWQYFAQRRYWRQQCMLNEAKEANIPRRPSDVMVPLRDLRQSIALQDRTFYHSIFEYNRKIIPKHDGYGCDACGGAIYGVRIICLDCQPPDVWFERTVDLCDQPVCCSATIPTSRRTDLERPHLPDHALLKSRTVIQLFERPSIDRAAKRALAAARAIFKEARDAEPSPSEENHHKDDEELQSESQRQEPANLVNGSEDKTDRTEAVGAEVADTKATAPQVKCKACKKQVQQPCWFCIDCYERDNENGRFFVCDDCEEQSLLACINCFKPYKQSTWYYGARKVDNFMCNKCTAKGIKLPEDQSFGEHTYLHKLVRCTLERENSEPVSKEAQEIATLKQTVNVLRSEMSSIKDDLREVRSMLSQFLAKQSDI